jgi:5-formyltetrahydrofolate cyclo-ligase
MSVPPAGADAALKQHFRERVWRQIDADPAVRTLRPAAGRIPGFVGAEAAAERLAALPAWRSARVLKLNPDTPQRPVRRCALESGKLLYMAVPRLASERPFLALQQSALASDVELDAAVTIEGAERHGRPTRVEELEPIELIVCGSVAVNASGVRIGKGAGYADLEFALLAELGLVGEQTLIATTVHDLQVLEEPLPETDHDFRLDLIVTPTRVLHCPRVERPRGLLWAQLSAEQRAAIPALRQAALRRT